MHSGTYNLRAAGGSKPLNKTNILTKIPRSAIYIIGYILILLMIEVVKMEPMYQKIEYYFYGIIALIAAIMIFKQTHPDKRSD